MLHTDSNNSKKGRVGGDWVSYGGNIQGEASIGKLLTVWDSKVKRIVEGITNLDKSSKIIVLTGFQVLIDTIKKTWKSRNLKIEELGRG